MQYLNINIRKWKINMINAASAIFPEISFLLTRNSTCQDQRDTIEPPFTRIDMITRETKRELFFPDLFLASRAHNFI